MAAQLKLTQLIPDGTYRFKSALKTDRCLEYMDNGRYDVRPIPIREKADVQLWQIKGNTAAGTANTYSVTNVASKLHLSFRDDKDKDGNSIRRLSAFTDGSQWTIEPRADTFVIGWEGNEQCVDYADKGGDDWAIVWDRNNMTHQRWILEPISTAAVTSASANQVKIVNGSAGDLEAMVTSYSNTNGSLKWFPIAAGQFDTWSRMGQETVIMRVKGGAEQEPQALTTGVYVDAKKGALVTFLGVGHPGVTVS